MGERLRIGVMGAGSVGCYVGGRLLAADAAEVVLVGRPRLQEEIGAHGLQLRGLQGRAYVPPDRITYVTEDEALAEVDVVLVSVKSAQTAEVAARLADLIGDETLVVSLQNGFHGARTLAAALGADRVVPAIVGFNVVSKGAGIFHSGMSGPLVLQRHSHPRFAALVAAFEETGLPVETPEDIAPEQWTKLLVNLNNAVSALSSAPTVELLREPGYRHVVAEVIDEGLDVLRAAGIRPARLRGVPVGWMPKVLRLPTPLVRLVTRTQMKVDPEARSSMWEDLTKGRPTEIDFLNGEIVRLAEESGVDAPLNRRIVELVHEAEQSGAGSPRLSAEALWARLQAA